MNDWMNPEAPMALDRPAAHVQKSTTGSLSLRAWDLLLVTAAALLLALAWPLLLWAALSAERDHTRLTGARHRSFTLLRWRFARGSSGHWLTRLGAAHWPTLINILRGDMAWVGPRPRRIGENAGPAAQLRPGLTGLHRLRQANSVDFMPEDVSDAEYLANRGLVHDARLLLLSAWHLGRRKVEHSTATPSDKVRILDVEVDNLLMEDAVHRVLDLIDAGRPAQVSFVNPACANIAAGDAGYRRDLAASTLVLPDGIGMKIAGDWLGTPIRQNVNGTDFFPRLCHAMNERRQRLYLVGARPQVVARVAEVVRERWPLIDVVGAQHGYFVAAQEASIVQDIKESGAHVVLVAMGVPMQERFIARNASAMGTCVAIGVGGLFDFVAGRISRAPQWMRDAGLEWVWRLLQEPSRMWKRYLLGNVTFLARVALQCRGWRAPKIEAPLPASAVTPRESTGQCAVLLATHAVDPDGSGPQIAASLPLGPASFAENIVAQLATHSVRDLHVLTAADGPSALTLQKQLGDGRRWGVRIHWHQSARPDQPYQPLRAVAETLSPSQPLWLIQSHTWLSATDVEHIEREAQIVVCAREPGEHSWQGWARVQPETLISISHAEAASVLESRLLQQVSNRYVAMARFCASAHDRQAWMEAQSSVPASSLLALQTNVWTTHPWGYASAQAYVSPHAHIEGPVWIGPGCIVRADAHVGPHVTLSRDVVVESRAVLSHAIGLPGAYFGPAGEDSRGGNVAAPLHTPSVNDAAATAPTQTSIASRWMGVFVAAALAPVVWPWLAMRKLLGYGPAWVTERVVLGRSQAGARLTTTTVRQPGPSGSSSRCLAWYGALLDVAEGRRHWVGVRPRRIEQWFALESDARSALAFAPIGLWHPVAWTNRLDCVMQAEAAADRLWLVRWRNAKRTARPFLATLRALLECRITGRLRYRMLTTL